MPTPNLYLAAQKLIKPHQWFSPSSNSPKTGRAVEHRNNPVPGTYEHRPGRGWYLIATDDPSEKLSTPVHVKYSRVLRRNLLEPDYDARKAHGKIRGKDGRVRDLGFFRLDDGIAWVNYLDEMGRFLPGPYKLWCIDKESHKFRPMLKGDDPAWQDRHSRQPTPTTPLSMPSPRSEDGISRRSSKSQAGATALGPASRPATPERLHASSQTSLSGSHSDLDNLLTSTQQESTTDFSVSFADTDNTAPTSLRSSTRHEQRKRSLSV